MRKPLVCMRGFRGRGWGDRGGGPDPPCENSNNNFTYFYFFFFTKNSPRTPPHPPRANNKNYSWKMNSCTSWIWGTYSYVSSINLNTAILIAVGVSICFVSFDNFPFIFLLTVWLFVRIAFIQYVNVWKSLILVIFKREKTIKYYRLNKRCVLVSK